MLNLIIALVVFAVIICLVIVVLGTVFTGIYAFFSGIKFMLLSILHFIVNEKILTLFVVIPSIYAIMTMQPLILIATVPLGYIWLKISSFFLTRKMINSMLDKQAIWVEDVDGIAKKAQKNMGAILRRSSIKSAAVNYLKKLLKSGYLQKIKNGKETLIVNVELCNNRLNMLFQREIIAINHIDDPRLTMLNLERLKALASNFPYTELVMQNNEIVLVKRGKEENYQCTYCHCFMGSNTRFSYNGHKFCCKECSEAYTIIDEWYREKSRQRRTNNKSQFPDMNYGTNTNGEKSASNINLGEMVAMSAYGDASKEFYAKGRKFTASQGHGFAAEEGNNLWDKIEGKQAEVIGYDNAKDGADRKVYRTEIQRKYCKTPKACIDACFNDAGEFRYIASNGKPMKIEVPSDMYDDAVEIMKRRIADGKVSGVTDPNQAKNIVREGHLTYNQAKNIAQFGTIESVTYDAVSGAVECAQIGSLSIVATFMSAQWDGKSIEQSIGIAVQSGIKEFGKAELTNITVGQFMRTATGKEFNSFFAKGMESVTGLSSKMIGTMPAVMAVQTVFLSFGDICKFLDGKLSSSEMLKVSVKNLTKVLSTAGGGIAGGVAGSYAGKVAGVYVSRTVGAAVGGVLGSALPVIGTVVGGIIGGIAVDSLINLFKDNDTRIKPVSKEELARQKRLLKEMNRKVDEMYPIMRDQFARLAAYYGLTENEVVSVLNLLEKNDVAMRMIDMYDNSDKKYISYASRTIIPCIIEVLSQRKSINDIG